MSDIFCNVNRRNFRKIVRSRFSAWTCIPERARWQVPHIQSSEFIAKRRRLLTTSLKGALFVVCATVISDRAFSSRPTAISAAVNTVSADLLYLSDVTEVLTEPTAKLIIAKAWNSPFYADQFNSYSEEKRRLLLFLLTAMPSDPKQVNTDLADFLKMCDDAKTLSPNLIDGSFVPTDRQSFTRAGLAYLLGYTEPNVCDFRQAAELFGKARDPNELRLSRRESLLQMYSAIGALQPLSSADILDLPANMADLQSWSYQVASSRDMILSDNFAYWLKLLQHMQGVGITRGDAYDLHFAARIQRAAMELDYLFIQRHMNLALRLGSLPLITLCKDVSQQAASFIRRREHLIAPVPIEGREFKFIDRRPMEILLGDDRMRREWPMRADLQVVDTPFLKAFLLQKLDTSRSVTCTAQGLNDLIALIDLPLSRFRDYGVISSDVWSGATIPLKDDIPGLTAGDAIYLQDLSTQFLRFLSERIVTLEFADTEYALDAMKNSLQALLRRNFEALAVRYPSEAELANYRQSVRFSEFCKGFVRFDVREGDDTYVKKLSLEIPEGKGYSKWGDTPVQRLEELALCIESVRSSDKRLEYTYGTLGHTLFLAARTVLLEFFTPQSMAVSDIAEIQNMSPLARSTLAMFYYWFNLDRLGFFMKTSFCDSPYPLHKELTLSVLPNFDSVTLPPYFEVLSECMIGALPRLYLRDTAWREFFEQYMEAAPFAIFARWKADILGHAIDGYNYNPNYKCSIDSEIHKRIDRAFNAVFTGEVFNDEITCTFWDRSVATFASGSQIPSLNKEGSPPRFLEIQGRAKYECDSPYLRGVTLWDAKYSPNLPIVDPDEFPSFDIDLTAVNSPSLASWGMLISMARTDPIYRTFLPRDFMLRAGARQNANLMTSLFAERESTFCLPSDDYTGRVVDVLPESFFEIAPRLRQFGTLYGENPFSMDAETCQPGWEKSIQSSVLFNQNWCRLLGSWNCKPDSYSTTFGALCHRTADATKWSDVPVFVEKIPYDSPFMLDNTIVSIADKPLYEVALTCARQYYRRQINPSGTALLLEHGRFLELSGLTMRSSQALITPQIAKSRQISELTFAKQMLHSKLVRDLHNDIEILAGGYVNFLVGSPDADEIRQSFSFDVFNLVLNKVASSLKTVNLWQTYNFLKETVLGEVANAVGNSLLRSDLKLPYVDLM